MKLIYLKSALKCDSFDVAIDIKIQFFRVLVTIEPGRSLLQFVTTNCLTSFENRCVLVRSNLFINEVVSKSIPTMNEESKTQFLCGKYYCLFWPALGCFK